MYFNSQFFPQFSGVQGGVAGMMGGAGGGALSSHPASNNSMQHSMNMLYMDSIQRQEHCSSGEYDVMCLEVFKVHTPIHLSLLITF